jgi:spore germination protein KA
MAEDKLVPKMDQVIEECSRANERLEAALGRFALRFRPGAKEEWSAFGGGLPFDPSTMEVSPDMSENERWLREAYGPSSDLVIRKMRLGDQLQTQIMIAYIDGMTDILRLTEGILKPITQVGTALPGMNKPDSIFDELLDRFLHVGEVQEAAKLRDMLHMISSGDTAVIVAGHPKALICGLRLWPDRGVEKPSTEETLRGPQLGFSETLRTNTSLLRRLIKTPGLWIEDHTIGQRSQTSVSIVYLKGVTSEELVKEVRERLNRIDTDQVLESGILEEFIEDAPWSPFPTVLRTERPDRVAACLFEGRVAILVDGTPFVLIVPCTLTEFLVGSDDYYERAFLANYLRSVRAFVFFFPLAISAFYIAVTTFHQEMLPTPLILSISSQREGIPFPAVIEILLLEFAVEVLRQASVLVPKIIGPAISIIGVLVVGQAAVMAGLVSNASVIIVAFGAIASFATPIYSMGIAIRLLRLPIILLAAALGLFGLAMGLWAILIHLTALRSFGVPYLQPLAPVVTSDLKDALIRLPWWAMRTRPALTDVQNVTRQKSGQMPEPPEPVAVKEQRQGGGGQ